jgi:nitrogen fixation protein FixH
MTEPRRDDPTASSEAAAARRWVAVVVGLLGFVVCTQTILITHAVGDPSVVAEPDYYRKAVAWDERMAQEERNAELGWRLTLSVRAGAVRGSREVICELTDAAGEPLPGAQVSLRAFHKARAGEPQSGRLAEAAPGRYAGELPLSRPGLWELRFIVRLEDEVFTARLERELTTAGEVDPA